MKEKECEALMVIRDVVILVHDGLKDSGENPEVLGGLCDHVTDLADSALRSM